MKWFIIVVMTQQLNAGKPDLPLYIPFLEFTNKETCQTFARNNQLRLFQKSIEAYKDSGILPTMISCVNEDIMKQVGKIGSDLDRRDSNEEDT